MKKISKLFFVITVIFMLLLGSCSYATEVQNQLLENTTSSDMVINGTNDELYNSNEQNGVMPINDGMALYYADAIENDLYLCEQNVSVEQNVNGNVYVMGQTVNISSELINGNIFVMGENVTLKGSVSGSVYVMGQTVNIEDANINSVYALAQTFNLEKGANIINDLKAAGETININGNVYRELYVGSKYFNVLDDAEYIAKGSVYYSDSCQDPRGLLSNINVVKTEDSEKVENTVKTVIIGETIKTQIVNIISAVLVIIVIYLLVKNKITENDEVSANSIVKTIVTGLCILVFTPILFIVLLCTIIGVPLAIILLVLYCIALYICVPVASLKIGSLVYNQLKQSNKIMIVVYAVCVYVIVELVSLIPTLGGLIKFLVILYGLGAFKKTFISSNNKKVEKEEEQVVETKTE